MESSARSLNTETNLGDQFAQWIGMKNGLNPLAARIATDPEGMSRTLKVTGALDKRIARALKGQAKAMAEAEGSNWSLDLSGVESWDSEGLSALVYALDISEVNGKQLTLLEPSGALRRTLERAQLHHLFQIKYRGE